CPTGGHTRLERQPLQPHRGRRASADDGVGRSGAVQDAIRYREDRIDVSHSLPAASPSQPRIGKRERLVDRGPGQPGKQEGFRVKNILLLIKGLGRGGAEQILVSSARYGDPGKFRYEVAYLLPQKDAFVPELEASGI